MIFHSEVDGYSIECFSSQVGMGSNSQNLLADFDEFRNILLCNFTSYLELHEYTYNEKYIITIVSCNFQAPFIEVSLEMKATTLLLRLTPAGAIKIREGADLAFGKKTRYKNLKVPIENCVEVVPHRYHAIS